MKNAQSLLMALILPVTAIQAQNNTIKTLGKSTYKISGNYLGTGNQALYAEVNSPDSIRNYARITGDTLFVTQEVFKKGAQISAQNIKVCYKHPKIKIIKPDEAFYNFKIVIDNNYDQTNNSTTWYLPTHDYTSSNNTRIASIYFKSKEQAEGFYINLKNGVSTGNSSTANAAATVSTDKKDDAQKELKIGLSNKSKTKIQICYEKNPGSRDLSYNTINSGSTITIFAKAGCNVYYVKEGSKEKQGVLLQISDSMNNTEQVIAK